MSSRAQQIEDIVDALADYWHKRPDKPLSILLHEMGNPGDKTLFSKLIADKYRGRTNEA